MFSIYREIAKRQHVAIITGRFLFIFLMTLAVIMAWRERFSFEYDKNTIVVLSVNFLLLSMLVVGQLQYIITHIIQIFLPIEDPVKSKKLVAYFMQVSVCIPATIPAVISAVGIFHLENVHIDNVYVDQAIVFQKFNQIYPDYIQYFGYITLSTLPLLVLYSVELSMLAGVMRPELQLHHILSIGYALIFCTSELSSTVIKVNTTQIMFGVLEWPLFLSLIHYRLTMNGDVSVHMVRQNVRIFSTLRFYWAFTRIAMVTLVLYFIIDGFRYMSLFLQWIYPIGLIIQCATLGMTQKELMGIHTSLLKKLHHSEENIEKGRRTMVSERNINIINE